MLKESLGVPTPDLSCSENCTTNRLSEAIVFTDVIPVCCTMSNQNHICTLNDCFGGR
jgi:hypothetical protein